MAETETTTKVTTTTTQNVEITVDMEKELEQSKIAMTNLRNKLASTLKENKELSADLLAQRDSWRKVAELLDLDHDVSEERMLYVIQELLRREPASDVDVTLLIREKDTYRAEADALRAQLREMKAEAEERLIASFVEAENAHDENRLQHGLDREQSAKEIHRLADQMERLRSACSTAANERDVARRAQLEAEKRADAYQHDVYESKMATAESKAEAKKASDLVAGLELQLKEAHTALDQYTEDHQILKEDRAAERKVKDSAVMESRIRLDEFKATRQKELENMRVALEDEREKLLKELEMRHEAESRMADLDVLVDQLRSDKSRLLKEIELQNQFRQNRDAMYRDVEHQKSEWDTFSQRIAVADEQAAQALAQVELIEVEKQTIELALQKSMHEREQLARLIVAMDPSATSMKAPTDIPINRL